MFDVDDLVICIDDTYNHIGWDFVPNKPIKGCVYTIRETNIILSSYPMKFVRLYEIINPIINWADVGKMEAAFEERRFKKIDKPKIDSILKLLEPFKSVTY